MGATQEFTIIDKERGVEAVIDVELLEEGEEPSPRPARGSRSWMAAFESHEPAPAERAIRAALGSIWPWLAFAIFIFAWFQPIMHIGDGWWFNHTRWAVPQRVLGALESWKAGLWDARWFNTFDNGYGYAFHSYYAPMFTWLSALSMKLWGCKTLLGCTTAPLRAVFAAWLVIGTIGSYLAGERFWGYATGGKAGAFRPGFFVAAAWLMSPYHFCNVYVRGDGAEFSAMQVYPWVFWAGVGTLGRVGAWRWRDSAELLAFLPLMAAGILSHNFTGMVISGIAVVTLLIVALMRCVRPPGEAAPRFAGFGIRALAWLAGIGCVLLMTIFYWYPALKEIPYTHIPSMKEGYFHYSRHYLDSTNYLVYPENGKMKLGFRKWDYGGDKPDPPDGMPLHLGWIGFVGGASALLGLLTALTAEPRRNWRLVFGIAALSAAGIVGIWLTTPSSRPVWDRVHLLQYAQFPYRLISIPTLAIALASPAFFAAVGPRFRRTIVAAGVLAFSIFFWLSARDYAHILHVLPNSGENLVENWKAIRIITTDIDEYRPVWAPIDRLPKWYAGTVLEDPQIKVVEQKSDGITFTGKIENNSGAPHPVVVAHNYFPGWKAALMPSKKRLKVLPDAATGFISVQDVPPGPQQLKVWFGNTPLRAQTKGVSAAAWIAWLVAWPAAGWWSLRGRKRIPAEAPNHSENSVDGIESQPSQDSDVVLSRE